MQSARWWAAIELADEVHARRPHWLFINQRQQSRPNDDNKFRFEAAGHSRSRSRVIRASPGIIIFGFCP